METQESTAQEEAQKGPTNTSDTRILNINSNDSSIGVVKEVIEENLGLLEENQPVQSDKEMDSNKLAIYRRMFSNAYVQEIVASCMASLYKCMANRDVGLPVNNVEFEEVSEIRMTKPMKPQTYDGTSDWPDYLLRFEMVAKYNGWDEREKLSWLAGSLRGEAMGTLGRLDELDEESYSSLVYYLNLRFGTDAEVYRLGTF